MFCYYQKRYLYIINGTLFSLKHSSNILKCYYLFENIQKTFKSNVIVMFAKWNVTLTFV